jgi:hypothetical protein
VRPIPPPADPWKCDGSVRDHRARVCRASYCSNPSNYPYGGCPVDFTNCPIEDATPIGCSCYCRVTVDNGAAQLFAKGTVISAH